MLLLGAFGSVVYERSAFSAQGQSENDLMNEGMGYEEAHAQSYKEYGIKANEEKNTFYTKEADMALYNADLNRY